MQPARRQGHRGFVYPLPICCFAVGHPNRFPGKRPTSLKSMKSHQVYALCKHNSPIDQNLSNGGKIT